MKTLILSFKCMVMLTICFTTNKASAETVPASDPFVLSTLAPVTIGTDNLLVSDSNALTGHYAYCWQSDASSSILCSVRDADDSEIYSTQTSSADSDITNTNVQLSDADELYLMYTATSGTASVHGFDGAGDALFPAIFIFSSFFDDILWQSLSMALTPSGFWVVGSVAPYEIKGTPNVTDLNIAYRFDRLGVIQQEFIDDINPSGTSYNCSATLSSNRSGDLIISWVEINNTSDSDAVDNCRGSIVSRIFRESGTTNGDFIDASDSRDDDDGYFSNPVSRADESGEFIIAWDDNQTNSSFATRVFPVGNGSVIAATELFSGSEPRIAGGTSGSDFLVFADSGSGGSCLTNARLALRGELSPVIEFNPDNCSSVMKDMLMLNDDSMLQIYEDGGNLYGERYAKPAEIEIGDVTISEGNSAGGQGPIAIISVTLSKEHPSGDEINVNYYTQDITALNGFDYPLTSGTLTFPTGSTIQEIMVPIIPDDDYENPETFSVNLELADNAAIRTSQSIVTILNDDTPPPIDNNCVNTSNGYCQEIEEPEGGESIDVEVILSIDTAQTLDITFSYETQDVTATSGSDYIGSNGSITIPAGSTETSLLIPVLGDTVAEATETFNLVFNTSSVVTVTQPTLEIAILNEPDCAASLVPATGAESPLEGGSGQFIMNTLDDCDWTLSADEDWITFPFQSSGTGSAQIDYEVAAQVSPEVFSRAGNIEITTTVPETNVATFTIVQDGDPSLCDFSVDQDELDFDANTGIGTFNVSAVDECAWDVFSDVSWLIVTSPTQAIMGDGVVEFTVTENSEGPNVPSDARSTVIGTGFAVTINQTGCSYSLSEDTVNISDLLNDGITTEVLAPDTNSSPCEWTAVSTASWILVTGGNAGEGFGTVTMEALENPSVDPRTGTVLIGDDMFSIVQDGQPCSYDVGDSEIAVCPDGLIDEVDISATAGCAWTLQTDQTWLQVNNNAKGVGDEIAEVQATNNESETARSGVLSFISGDPDPGSQIDKTYTQTGYLVYEIFDDRKALPEGIIVSPEGLWQVGDSDEQLEGNLLNNGFGIAVIASETAYCSDCKVEGLITMTSVSSISETNIGLLGWYQSDFDYISLTMDEFANLWRLSLVQNGVELMVEVDGGELLANQTYQLTISYDDQFIYGSVDGEQVLQLTHQLTTAPVGYPGFMLNNAKGNMDDLAVTGSSADADLIFTDSFETETFDIPSQCSL